MGILERSENGFGDGRLLKQLFAAVLISGSMVACGTDPAADAEESSAEQSIIGGTVDTADASVVMLFVHAPGESAGSLCSGSIISPTRVLTAAHCVDPRVVGRNQVFEVRFRATLASSFAVPVVNTWFDPAFDKDNLPGGHDVAVVELAFPTPLAPLAINRGEPATGPVRLVGYGTNTHTNQGSGIKRQATANIVSRNDRLLGIGNSDTQVCHGDSGGPAFQTINGREVIIGIASYVFDSAPTNFCHDGGFHTRVDAVTAFIDEHVPLPPAELADDILWRGADGQVAIWFMKGDGNIASQVFAPAVPPPPAPPPTSPGLDWVIKFAGDFNRDGKADILWLNRSGQPAIWFMNDGVIVGRQEQLPVQPSGWSIQGIGDFNFDGWSDVLWRSSTGQMKIWLMGNGGNIVTERDLGVVAGAVQGIGDFDFDGTSDILMRESNGKVVILFIRNGAISSRPSPGTPEGNWVIQGVGDFNGDGKADILWRDANGQVSIWIMDGNTVVLKRFPPLLPNGNPDVPPTADWVIKGIGDFNHDGKADILWRDSDVTVSIWFVHDDDTVTHRFPEQAEFPGQQPGPEWTIAGVGNFN